VVIPNFNGERWLPGVLESVAAQTAAPAEVVVVDDGSTDASLTLLATRFPHVRVVARAANGGFARAANDGIGATTADAVALVNTDVVLDPRWLETARTALDAHPGAASVATKLVDLADPELLYDAGDVLRRDGACEQRGRFERDTGAYDEPGEVFAACAGAALYRRAAIAAAGGFDERLGMYLEDVDLGLRLQLAGWTCRWEPRAVAAHAGEGSGAGAGARVSATRCCSSPARSRCAGCRTSPTARPPGRGTPRAPASSGPCSPVSAPRCRCSRRSPASAATSAPGRRCRSSASCRPARSAARTPAVTRRVTPADAVAMVRAMPVRRRLAVLVAAAALLAAPAPALAQSAGDEQYEDPFAGQNDNGGGNESQQPAATATPAPAQQAPAPAATAAPSTGAAPAASGSTSVAPASGQAELPRTGLDTAPLIVLGTVLLASGVALRVRLRERR